MSKLRDCLTVASIERQNFGLVFEKLLSVLYDSFGDAIKIFNLIGLQFVKHSLKTLDKLVSCFSSEHIGGAELRDDLGI